MNKLPAFTRNAVVSCLNKGMSNRATASHVFVSKVTVQKIRRELIDRSEPFLVTMRHICNCPILFDDFVKKNPHPSDEIGWDALRSLWRKAGTPPLKEFESWLTERGVQELIEGIDWLDYVQVNS